MLSQILALDRLTSVGNVDTKLRCVEKRTYREGVLLEVESL